MSEFLISPAVHCQPVPEWQEHVKAVTRNRGKKQVLARLGRENHGEGFDFEWCIGVGTAEQTQQRAEVEASLDFLSGQANLPDFWYYLIYHCGTAANLYAAKGGGLFWEWRKL